MKIIENEHTPTPWHVVRGGSFGTEYWQVEHRSGTRHKTVAIVQPVKLMNYYTDCAYDNTEGEADARLIASAPDMLKELIQLRKLVKTYETNPNIVTDPNDGRGCDRCGMYVPNGDGYYSGGKAGDRLCESCYDLPETIH